VESSVDLLRWQFGLVHGLLDHSSGCGTPVATARYAAGVVIEDITVSSLLAGRRPLALSTWRGRTGLSRLPPLRRCLRVQAWADNVDINVTQLRTYAQAVYAATDSYLSGFALAHDRLTCCVLTALLLSLSTQHELRE
jgi:hypothetical protein